MSTTRKAVVYDSSAGKLGMKVKEIPTPAISSKQVLVAVKAMGTNPVDYKLPHIFPVSLTAGGKVVGNDFAGVVDKVGADVADFKVGDKVFGLSMLMTENAACAQYIAADPSKICKMPSSLDFSQAASIPTAALTSLQAITVVGNKAIKAGDSVLVLGASGGCGSTGVMVAKALGATVTAVCSGKNADLVKRLGADKIVDYTKGAVRDALEGETFDMVYDTVTSPDDVDYYPHVSHTVKPGGKYVAINANALDWIRFFISQSCFNVQKSHNFSLMFTDHAKAKDGLGQLSEMVTSGKFQCITDSTFPLTQEGVEEAYARLKSRRAVGKIIITMP